MPVRQNCQAGESPALQKRRTRVSALHQQVSTISGTLPGAVQANQRLTAKMTENLLQTNVVTHKYARINSLQLSAISSEL